MYASLNNNFTGADYDQQSVLVIIAPGAVMQKFTVNITDDDIIECNEFFNLSISTEGALCGLTSSNNNTQVMIENDDGKKFLNCIDFDFYLW